MAVSWEVFRQRLAVGVFFLIVAALFAVSVTSDLTGEAAQREGLRVEPPPPPPPPDLETFRAKLSSADPNERAQAMIVLRARGDTEVVGWILRALGDPHPLVRRTAIREVRTMGPTYLAYIAPLIADPDRAVRAEAVAAFEQTPALAVPYVHVYLAHPDSEVARTAWSLFEPIWRADPAAGRPILAAALAARDEEIRAAAAAFARALPPDDRRPFDAYLERIPAETPAAVAGTAPVRP